MSATRICAFPPKSFSAWDSQAYIGQRLLAGTVRAVAVVTITQHEDGHESFDPAFFGQQASTDVAYMSLILADVAMGRREP